MSDLVPKWYAEYMNISTEAVFELMQISNFLDIDALLDLCCLKIATEIKGKTPEEISDTFNIEDQFTEEEKQIFVQAHNWKKPETFDD